MIQEKRTWTEILTDGVEELRSFKRSQVCMEEWFYVQEIKAEEREAMLQEGKELATPLGQAELLCRVVERMPISIQPGSAIAGTQDGAFSPSYALINPAFKVEEFAGYCDPTAIYNDIKCNPKTALTQERIEKVRQYWKETDYVKKLEAIYARTGAESKEVVYFMEPVTGHTIPDLRPYLKKGVRAMQEQARASVSDYGQAMATALEAACILASRYQALAEEQAKRTKDEDEAIRLGAMAEALQQVPAGGARNLQEAVQAFTILWQIMVLEQAPNPYAFSAGNLDRVFEPYYQVAETEREDAIALMRHLFCFFQVGSRCWAISQNIIIGGRDTEGNDLVNPVTEIICEAFFRSNDPQPALSIKVHAKTPESFYRSLGRFFFTPGRLTPSVFNDDTLFEMLGGQGVAPEDLPDYSIAGCQEPLIMGKSSLNTTNTWLNLGKVLELAANDGMSFISGKQLGPTWKELGFTNGAAAYTDLEAVFYKMLDYFLPRMQEAGNACTELLGKEKPVPFTSAVMDSFSTWRDMRDPYQPGVRYNGSGCLIHGLSVVTDSLYALTNAVAAKHWEAGEIQQAMANNWHGADEFRQFLQNQEKWGNNNDEVDSIAVRLAHEVCTRIRRLRNPAGNPYLADWSTPSTHLLYGYWVGATPDGREARSMLGYGLDPLPDSTRSELPERFISAWKLPYLEMTGGYASHIGVRPDHAASAHSLEDKGIWMRDRIFRPLFKLGEGDPETPFYVYFNVGDAGQLRKVLDDPKTYAPSGVYIMRIHGTFVNFLDLSPSIQEDIIIRLESGGHSA
ncbi:MAG: pyruvate formate lyase family protein [Planctomycetes bacterium]|nr:pyruvate formate lyase family protein [Planctomycetota bacterium]